MITAIVQFQLPKALTRDEAKKIFEGSAPGYQGMQGLVRKNYLLSEDGKTAGGAYTWESREAADAVYNDEWRALMVQRYGAPPSVTYFESPVLVDNERGTIESN